MRVPREAGPPCGSRWVKSNGHLQTGTQHPRGKRGGRACVLARPQPGSPAAPRPLLERLLRARLARRGLCRAGGVGLPGLVPLLGERVPAAPAPRSVEPVGGLPPGMRPRREAELAALGRLVGQTAPRHGGGSALEAPTRPVRACQVGDRRGQSAPAGWEQRPAVSQARARFSTDPDEGSKRVMPSAHHRASTKLARTTPHGERCTCPVRQRVARRVRATLSFSKKLSPHMGARKYCMCDSTRTKCAALPG